MKRYQGRWYEIAKYPFPSEYGCTSAIADYRLIDKNLIITNTCLFGNQIMSSLSALGIPKGNNTFDVYFSFNTPPGEYKILWTDYVNWSFVSGGNQYWILSRKQRIDYDDLRFILRKTKQLGYDKNKLQLNLHNFK